MKFNITPDETFKIGAFSDGKNLTYEFYIIHKGSYYKMVFEFGN